MKIESHVHHVIIVIKEFDADSKKTLISQQNEQNALVPISFLINTSKLKVIAV